ncbi:MAG: succinate dehydrogenase, hydrophobic membrane anchor protein [Zoogloeaceae bacterium]|jgi:succinate dehydrogenase / fumarate reductase membrane anchor subunit|nr:succinate dehydrogenase, hydrophobic membrane anchor protein [Zoogloeaceae bacterium]
MVNKIIVGAHYGLKDWLIQRISAVFMVVYCLVFIILLLGQGELDYAGWRAFMAGGLMRFLTFLFIVNLMYHAWVGVRDIWMDYAKPTSLRFALHILTLLALIGYTGWAVSILWRL